MNLQLLYPGVGGGIRFLPHPFIYNLYQIARVIVLKCLSGSSLAVQWVGLHPFTTGSTDLIPGWGAKIPQIAEKKVKQMYHTAAEDSPSSLHLIFSKPQSPYLGLKALCELAFAFLCPILSMTYYPPPLAFGSSLEHAQCQFLSRLENLVLPIPST